MPKIHDDRMWAMDNQIMLYKSEQIAYPVGPKKSSYTIVTCAWMDTTTQEVIKIECEAVKNWSSRDNSEIICTGTYKECYDFIEDVVLCTNLQPA